MSVRALGLGLHRGTPSGARCARAVLSSSLLPALMKLRLVRLAALSSLALPVLAALSAALAPAPALADKALLVGIDVYADDRLSFEIPGASARDVDNMKRLLTNTLGFAERDIRVLIDSAAAKQAILGGIRDWLAGGTQPGERTYFFYVGHGFYQADDNGDEADGTDETIVPHDARIVEGETENSVVGMITDDELGIAFKALSDRAATVVFDSCHSGTVTRSASPLGPGKAGRTPNLKKFRSIVVEEKVAEQKAEGTPMSPRETPAGVTVWTAVSSSQVALIDTDDAPDYHGVFTAAYVKGLETKAADRNRNGEISNAELLAYVRTESDAYCNRHADQCEMGLTPTLDPAAAFADDPAGDPVGDPATTVDADTILDFFAGGNDAGVVLYQDPPSPVRVGTRNIRFRVTSPVDGQLVLLNLTDDGELIQLFPNQFARDAGRAGVIRGGATITVPDAYYGMRFDATAPTSGTLVALVALEPIDWPAMVGDQRMAPIPAAKAVKDYLPRLAAALGGTRNTDDPGANTRVRPWAVATLRYEIVGR